ncbi:hypothetical protein BOX17_08205 [Halomonas aestuarii]|uniref:Uncharacterized protein n=1 Tax=Halomonas aestuarii TaxID=1897729 RepID=A0A1J0VG17_9GAMM|nr:hypothetical protein [Halomonas aestuarii]APE30938.1 hypothetical protein BOX17_08205 [Halomonas aestuarii]
MRQFLFPRRPLARATILTCHLLLQLGLLAGAALWLVPRLPWLMPSVEASNAWPPLALGGGLWLLAALALRLLTEVCLLPHHLKAQRPGFAPGAVVTRSWERRPAVHDDEAAWTRGGRHVDAEESVLGSPRVVRPAERCRPARPLEPTQDPASGAQVESAWAAPSDPAWQAPQEAAWGPQPAPTWDTRPEAAWGAPPASAWNEQGDSSAPPAAREPLF